MHGGLGIIPFLENKQTMDDDVVQSLQNLLQNADQERIEGYMKMLDRILLYNLAANIMPDESKQDVIKFWDKVIKKTIDLEVTKRTEFLEGTPVGRIAKYRKEPDGELHRLHCLKHWAMARQVISANLERSKEDYGNLGEFDTP